MSASNASYALVPLADRSAPKFTATDALAVADQLGRAARSVAQVAARCACGTPLVVRTFPLLDDGTPFPTSYYLTHPGAAKALGRVESSGLMAEMNARLAVEPALARAHAAAHADYLERRFELGAVDQIATVSAGGMPTRVKCLHALAAHALACGPGVNVLGDEALVAVSGFWRPDTCACGPSGQGPDAADQRR